MLTDAAARKRKPDPDKRVEIHDGHGLYLVIQSSGAKSWAYRPRRWQEPEAHPWHFLCRAN